ncbi:hypothetical protein ACJIZ3_011303 [Penstemon smallii]|uniref:Nitrate regulatory gene2 protein-like n=1 Tax=Penstemon smallii TaxID=265156 RepID=A0ABD3UKY2_9LAMI
MGCSYSKLIKIRSKLIEEESAVVSKCRARKGSMKEFLKSRNTLSDAHSMYLKSLKNTGSAFLQLVTAEIQTNPHPLPTTPVSPTSRTATSSTVPPPPLPIPDESYDIFTLFYYGVLVDECEETTTTMPEARNVTEPPSSSEPGVSSEGKGLVEIIKELGDYFFEASKAGDAISKILEVPTCNSNHKATSTKFREDYIGCVDVDGKPTHRSTVESLYKWEKKLYKEVKIYENLRLSHEKKMATLRKLEIINADSIRIGQMMVSSQAIKTTSSNITELRDSELRTQLLEIFSGLMGMWRSMYKLHQAQIHIVQQHMYLNCKSKILRQSILQVELEAQQWHISFSELIKAQRDYIQSITMFFGSLLQIGDNLLHKTPFHSLYEKWQAAIGSAPDKVALEGMERFLTLIHAIGAQQAEEKKQKSKSELAHKEIQNKIEELILLEHKHAPKIREERAKVDILRANADNEKYKYVKSVIVTREITMNNLKMGLVLGLCLDCQYNKVRNLKFFETLPQTHK